jgi:hypothetical protein
LPLFDINLPSCKHECEWVHEGARFAGASSRATNYFNLNGTGAKERCLLKDGNVFARTFRFLFVYRTALLLQD